MRVVFSAQGTRGDVQPVLALGIALREAGHDVCFFAPEDFGSWITSFGFEYHDSGGNVGELLKEAGADMERLGPQMRYVRQRVVPLQFSGAMERFPSDGADVVIGSGMDFVGRTYADAAGLPYAFTAYVPMLLPSSYHPPPGIKTQRWPRLMNKLIWLGARPAIATTLAPVFNAERKRAGFAPVADVFDYMFNPPMMMAADPTLAPVPPGTPERVVTTGAFIFDSNQTLDDDLRAFLDDGDPPVFLGFGSMRAGDAEQETAMYLRAAEAAGCRIVIGSGWAGLGVADVPAWCRVVGRVPHDRLFPHMAGVVHHGGAGTTTTVARAGIPHFVAPHLLDQYYWARRIELLDLGPKPIPVRSLTQQQLTDALRQLTTDVMLQARARTIGAKVRAQAGNQAGVAYVEKLASRTADGG